MNLLLSIFLCSAILFSSYGKDIAKREFESLDELTDRLQKLTEQEDKTQKREYSGSCGAHYEKVGCFKDRHHAKTLDKLLFNDRVARKGESKPRLDWNNWNDYIKDLACRCAEAARKMGYVHFGLQYYGECFAGHESQRRYDHYGRSSSCTSANYNPCDDDSPSQCVGAGFTNYVYHVDPEGSGGGEVNPNAYDSGI